MAFTTRSYWHILIVHLVRRNQRLEGGEVSESGRAYGSATGGAWLCSSIFGFSCIQTFTGLSRMRRNGVGRAWSNGLAVMLFIFGVFMWCMCITKGGRHDDLLRGVLGGYCLSRVFSGVFPSSVPLSIPHGDLRSTGGSCGFFSSFYIPFSLSSLRLGRWRFGFYRA